MDAKYFFSLEAELKNRGLDSDLDSFDVIKRRLVTHEKFNADEFARQAIYVVLASGFSQKTAKKKHTEIMAALRDGAGANELMSIFGNVNKVTAIIKLWNGRQVYRDDYYTLETLDEKLSFLSKLPHVGKITRDHFARNLGENVFKRDVWIERLLQKYGKNLFDKLEKETGFPRGYIDVILWKACQNGIIKFD